VERLLLLLFKRFAGKTKSHHPPHTESLSPEERVQQIQNGDAQLRNDFIADYTPYIIKMTSQFCRRYIDPARDDEFSIALGAFNEAINRFSPSAGRSFLGFAETVIRRRLIDYVRKEARFSRHIPYSSFDSEEEGDLTDNPVEIYQAMEEYDRNREAEERRHEIEELSRALSEFGIAFADLVHLSPKHRDSRENLFVIGKRLSEDAKLIEILMEKKMLPIKELMEQAGVSRKTLERNRKYLIAIALIFNGPYPHLQNYLHIPDSQVERRGEP
jgi:RNA polymerase sigma factor